MNQIDAADKLIQALEDERAEQAEPYTNLSTRELIETMAELGLAFSTGDQTEAIAEMDRMDAA